MGYTRETEIAASQRQMKSTMLPMETPIPIQT
jgi:hypothetical protein